MEAAMTEGVSLLKAMAASIDLFNEHRRATASPDAVPRGTLRKEADTLGMVNNAGGRAPPLVLMKRTEAPMASFSDLIKSADQLIRAGGAANIEAANDCLEKAERMVSKARRTTITHEDFDPTDFASPSDPATDAPDGDEEVDDDWDEEDDDVKKADEHFHYPHYGATSIPATPSSYGRGPNQHGDPYATGSNPTTGAPSKTAFDLKVDMVQARDQTARHIAMATARNEFPREFSEHQNSLSEGPTRNQHARRSARQATKSAPSCYEDLIAEQIAKGCNYETAAVRIAQLHGYDAQRNYPSLMRKAADLSGRFDRIVKHIASNEYLTLEKATREARLRNPALYKALRSI
jgi:hypothetical protein